MVCDVFLLGCLEGPLSCLFACLDISLLICFLVPFFPLNNKIQFLKVNSRIQLKFRNEIFYLKKGDSLFIENIEIFYQEKNKLSLQKLDYTKKIDFNVNNYQYLNLEF